MKCPLKICISGDTDLGIFVHSMGGKMGPLNRHSSLSLTLLRAPLLCANFEDIEAHADGPLVASSLVYVSKTGFPICLSPMLFSLIPFLERELVFKQNLCFIGWFSSEGYSGKWASKRVHLVQVSLTVYTGNGKSCSSECIMQGWGAVLKVTPRALHMLPECSSTELYPQTQDFHC